MCLWDMKWEKVILGSKYLQIGGNAALSLPITFLGIVTASPFYDIRDGIKRLVEVGAGTFSLPMTLE